MHIQYQYVMKYKFIFKFCCVALFPLFSFAQDTLRLSPSECEAVFLKENLALLATHLKIGQAEAQIQQAKLWPNPTLTVDQINFWATPGQTDGKEVSPPFLGNVGRNQQVAVEVEQLIYLAGKRKKLVAMHQVSAEQSIVYFQEVLRNLKYELRLLINDAQFLQEKIDLYQSRITATEQLTNAFGNQVKKGNIPASEHIRLQAVVFDQKKNLQDLNMQYLNVQKSLKNLLKIDGNTPLYITPTTKTLASPGFALTEINSLIEERSDVKLAALDKIYQDKLLIYEKAQRTPDITFKGAYDRNGSTMLNFVGFGASIDLPFSNRNQGNIKSAQLGVKHSELHYQQKQLEVRNEIQSAYLQYQQSVNFLNNIPSDYESNLDQMLDNYTKNFKLRNINIIEFIDFENAYLDNKNTIFEMQKLLKDQSETLNHFLGKDLF